MKKFITIILTAAFSLTLFTGCEDTEVFPPMNGAWKCVKVSLIVGDTETPVTESSYLSLFSIVYEGVVGSGVYSRTGTSSLGDATSTLVSDDTNWSDFLTYGTFTYDSSAKTITHTSLKDSKTETYTYEISDDGETLTLTQLVESEATSYASSVSNILGGIFNTTINTSTGVSYTYSKSSISEITSLVQSSDN